MKPPKGVSRQEMYNRLGMVTPVDDTLKWAYEEYNRKEWEKGRGSPHGRPWFTSFHGSAFPMSKHNCARKAMYTMMDIPNPEPFSADGMGIMDAGTDIEHRAVEKLHKAGRLLSKPPGKGQTGFEDKDSWLTGSLDAVILPLGWDRPHVVEIKGKDDDAIWKMKKGEASYSINHRNQLFAYMWGIRKFRSLMLPGHDDLGDVTDGSVLYISRNRPNNRKEWYFEYDEKKAEAAIQELYGWQQLWKNEELPDRPKSWKWGEEPCRWCDFKKICKADLKAGVTKLKESEAIKLAKHVDKTYKLADKQKLVAKRWNYEL